MEDFENDLKKVISFSERTALKRTLQGYENDMNRSTPLYKRPWLAAASIVVLFTVISYTMFFNTKMDSQELYSTYFEPYRNVISPISRSGQSRNLESNGYEAYEKGQYKEALGLLEQNYTRSGKSVSLLYQGICLLQLERTEDAIDRFRKQLNTKDKFNNVTRWYLVLAYLKLNKKKKAKALMELMITSKDTYRRDDVITLLEQLN